MLSLELIGVSKRYGARYALPIWSAFMGQAARLRAPEPFAMPPEVREVRLCLVSHQLATKSCPAYSEYFKDGDLTPTEPCPMHGGPNVGRRVERFFSGLGRRVVSLFKR